MRLTLDKFVKLLTRKTAKGKINILIDILCHGAGRLGYIGDQLLHMANEGRFSWYKFRKYGNARRIFGFKKRPWGRWFR